MTDIELYKKKELTKQPESIDCLVETDSCSVEECADFEDRRFMKKLRDEREDNAIGRAMLNFGASIGASGLGMYIHPIVGVVTLIVGQAYTLYSCRAQGELSREELSIVKLYDMVFGGDS